MESEIIKFMENEFNINNQYKIIYGKNCKLDYDKILNKLKEKFSNINVSKYDIYRLYKAYCDNENVKLDIWQYEQMIKHGGDCWLISVGKKGYEKNKLIRNQVKEEYQKKMNTFSKLCETMNNVIEFDDPSFNFEENIFRHLSENEFRIKSVNPIINKFYESYVNNKEKDLEISKLQQVIKIQDKHINNLNNEITELKNENIELRENLDQQNNLAISILEKIPFFGKKLVGKYRTQRQKVLPLKNKVDRQEFLNKYEKDENAKLQNSIEKSNLVRNENEDEIER